MSSPPRSNRQTIPKRLEVVCIVWEDAALGQHDGSPETVDGETVENYTLGFLVKKTRQVVVVAVEASPKGNTVRWDYTIPRRLVRAIISISDLATLKEASHVVRP